MASTMMARTVARAPGTEASNDLDASALARIQPVCNFINAEVARWRNQLIAVGAATLFVMVPLAMGTRIVTAGVAIVVVGGVVAFWFVRARRELASTYGSIATKRLVSATSKALTYQPASSLTRKQFVALDLFPMAGARWRGAHEIRGRAGNATFSLHAVHARRGERGPDVFRGTIIRVDFASSFPGHTVVLPERHGADGGGSARTKRDLVLVKNPEFERLFSAYSTEYAPARRLFTAGVTQLIIAATRTFGPDLRLVFLGPSLYVAVPSATPLPEVTLRSAPLTPEAAAGALTRLTALAGALARELGSTS